MGHWIIEEDILNRIHYCLCSKCNKDSQDYVEGTKDWWLGKLPNYCPHCGENMIIDDNKDNINKSSIQKIDNALNEINNILTRKEDILYEAISEDTSIKKVRGFSTTYPSLCNLKLIPNIDRNWITIQDDIGVSITVKLSDLNDFVHCENLDHNSQRKESEEKMTREQAIEILTKISYALGTMAVEYLSEKDGEKMREAINVLEQEPFINKPCISKGVCHEDKNKVLDKISAEIEREEDWLKIALKLES